MLVPKKIGATMAGSVCKRIAITQGFVERFFTNSISILIKCREEKNSYEVEMGK
tara:strand:- start:19552 stop:19713 length:162 start_codon:yes stop_codon:yes gene_type:complete